MRDKCIAVSAALDQYCKSGQTWMFGGFGRGGVAFTCLEELARRSQQYQNLTIVKNDANEPNLGVGMLLNQGMVRKMIATHIGLNPDAVRMMNEKKIEVEFVPQGIFAERIRIGGSGIPAFLSDIGLGTIVAQGKPTMEFQGKTYLLESALRANVAFLCADVVDRFGNCWFKGSNRNMNVVMSLAADSVIVEAKKIVETGTLEPENIHIPGVVVSAVVQAQPRAHIQEPGGGIA
ncbi:MAG: 3-oxoacid CoA-transferase subunit A [Candidatus Sumerlaeia bacterium]|nr:3-oxoacid CoA-transferase subunit A [Candidatus Sumerlaeia bacterium]